MITDSKDQATAIAKADALEEADLCSPLWSETDSLLRIIETFLEENHAVPLVLGEILDDIGNDYLRLADRIVDRRRYEAVFARRK